MRINKMRVLCKKKVIFFIVSAITVIIILHPSLNARRNYEYILREDILYNLYEETAENFTSTNIVQCDYRDIVDDDTTLSISISEGDLGEGHRIREGGEYSPPECKPRFSTAVIVPYRDKAEQLRGFLVYMHTFFRRQKIHYRIYIVEQVDSQPFNKAKLMNIGAIAAMKSGYPCLVFHDMDLLPLRPANIYACTILPRHMSASINQFRFVLPYLNLFGGAVAITAKQYQLINGMSNRYFGLRGEDDDLYLRLEALDIKLCRFDPETSRYHMASQSTIHKGEKKVVYFKDSKTRISTDGLTSLKYTEVATVLHPLFTHIMVDL